ncbi:Deleted in malignant brain tumors 1 protein, partial [Struthio camelus australis]
LRLVNGPHSCSGRVEVFHNQQWGTVCDDSWDLNDAKVVCKQLDCGTAISAPGSSLFGQGSGPIWLDGVSCLGTEATLSECPAKPLGQHGCNHVEDASVTCSAQQAQSCARIFLTMHISVYFSGSGISSIPKLRLVDGLNECAGRVEVFYNHEWGTVCDDSWDMNDAMVVCRQLGCGMALSAPGSARFGWGSNRIWLDDVSCTGTETDFSECKAKSWGIHNCHHGEDAGVVCSGETWTGDGRRWGGTEPSKGGILPHRGTSNHACRNFPAGSDMLFANAGNMSSGDLRLVNGPNRCAGRVEVLHNQQWGTVCDDGWDLNDATVVCQQLGCGRAESAFLGAHFGQGSGPIWLDDVSCVGTEDALSQCRARPWGQNNCNHREDAGVVCSGTETALSECRTKPWGQHSCSHVEDASVVCSVTTNVTTLRLVNGPHRCAGRVEIFHNQQWGTVCDDGWNLNDATVVCRQLGCGRAESAFLGAHFGQGSGPIWLDDVSCVGTEDALSQCRARPWGQNNCNHREDAGVVC